MIAGRATPVKMAPGHEICSQGDPADCIWLLHEGTLRDLPPVSVCSHAQSSQERSAACTHEFLWACNRQDAKVCC